MNASSSDGQFYKCDLCHFDSANAVSLKKHMRTHTEEKPFKCNLCDFASVWVGNLRRHLKTHTGEKSHKCNQCDYASAQAGNLRTHLKTHSGEKPYKCNQCDFASARSSHLRDHLKTHAGEKSHKCSQCDYASVWESNLRRHLKIHSGEKLTKCNQCDFDEAITMLTNYRTKERANTKTCTHTYTRDTTKLEKNWTVSNFIKSYHHYWYECIEVLDQKEDYKNGVVISGNPNPQTYKPSWDEVEFRP